MPLRLELELGPALSGALTGLAIYLLQYLLAASARRGNKCLEEQEAEALEAEFQEPLDTPTNSCGYVEEPEGEPFVPEEKLTLPDTDLGDEEQELEPTRFEFLRSNTLLAVLTALLALGLAIAVYALLGKAHNASADSSPETESGMETVSILDAFQEQPNQKMVTLNLTRQEMVITDAESGATHYKSAYWSTLQVGTPASEYRVVVDTGSGHLLLPSGYCHSETCRAHKRYRRSKSSSARDINHDGELVRPGEARDQISVTFGSGEVGGVFVEERVCVALPGLDDAPGCTPLRMIAATSMSEEFKAFEFDGVLGLSLPGLAQAPEFCLLHALQPLLRERGAVAPQLFSVFLAADGQDDSELTFGGYSERRMGSQLAWNTVVSPKLGHWMLRVKSVKVDGRRLDYCRKDCRAVLDSGTSLLAVPTAVFPELYGLLRHEAEPSAECRGRGPRLRIELENFTLVLDPRDYARPRAAEQKASKPKARQGNASAALEVCRPFLMTMDLPAPVGPKLFVLGEPILRKYYTVYDTTESKPRIGFAHARHGRSDPETAP